MAQGGHGHIKRRGLVRYLAGLGLLALLLGHAAQFYRLDPLSRLDAILYDAKLRLAPPLPADERIVIIDIDERSLAEVGRWPWSRDRLALLVDNAFGRYGVALLGLDLILAEADDSSGLAALDALARGPLQEVAPFQEAMAKLRPQLEYDRRFAEALRRHPVVLGFHFSGGSRHAAGVLPPPALPADGLHAQAAALPVWDGHSGNRPEFQSLAQGAGYTNGLPDFDGISRRVPLIARYRGEHYEALSLAMLRAALGGARLAPRYVEQRFAPPMLEALELAGARGTLRIPVDAQGAALIPFRGGAGSFRYVSAADVLAGRLAEDALLGRIAILGTTAPGLLDLRATPVGEAYPGVEVHANLISGMLDGRIRARPPYAVGIETVTLLALGLVLVFRLPRLSPLASTLLAAALAAAVLGLDFALWEHAGLALPLAASLVLVAGLYAFDMSFGYFVESRTKRQLTELFGQYVPPELVKEMSRNPERYDMEGRSAELTVLFSDIRSFTAMSEGLAPQELARLMNEYFSAMTAVIRAQRGTLDKYIGDAIMAFWGAPVADDIHAGHAVAAALQMQRRLAILNDSFVRRGWPRLAIGTGINTGVMTVGDMGSRERKAYTVLGDAVNLASRLEGLTSHYGLGTIVGEATRTAAAGFVWREIDRVRVKGRASALAIYEPVCAEGEADDVLRAELVLWAEALARYRARDWDAAAVALQSLAAMAPARKLYPLYLQRIAKLRLQPPPEGWDGVWRFETK